jgi:TP901 family phage tail tape measure protein
MGNSQVFELAILLSLKDMASGGLDRVEAKLRAAGKEGKATLQTFQSLREGMKRDLAFAGVGVASLTMLKKGIDVAAEYETSLLDLKSAYQEVAGAGNMSAEAQAAQLNQLENLAVRLGNNLQGSTSDYIGILSSLRKAGVDTQTVLGGAGEAASYLANVSGALTRGGANDLAKQLGQYGQLYKLKPDEFKKSVDLFSALKDRFDIDSADLIESAKYFQNTASSLKLTGFGGAEETSKFFALIKRQGAIEGSQAGTSATSFFQQFIANAEQRAKIKKKTGFDIQLFDTKGNFLGLENAFKEMEKFRKFSSEKRLSMLNELFGEQGGKVAGVMVDAGAEGWRNVTTEAGKAVPVQEKINAQMETFNAKMEALKGTLTNIAAVGFTPLMNETKPLIDAGNNIAGLAQELAQSNPEVAGLITNIAGLGGAAVTLSSGLKIGAQSWRMWQIGLGNATEGASGLKGKLDALSRMSTLKLTVGIAAVGAGVAIIEWMMEEVDKRKKIIAERKQVVSTVYEEGVQAGQLYKRGGLSKEDVGRYDKMAQQAFELVRVLPSFQYGIQPEETQGGKFSIRNTATEIRESNVGLADPNVLARLIRQLDKGTLQLEGYKTKKESGEEVYVPGRNITGEEASRIKEMLSDAFGETFKVAQQKASEQFISEATILGETTGKINLSFAELWKRTLDLPPAISRTSIAFDNFAFKLRDFQPTISINGTPFGGFGSNTGNTNQSGGFPGFKPPKSAIGSIVQKSGLVEAHAGNVITPAILSRRSSGDWLSDFGALKAIANLNVRARTSVNAERNSKSSTVNHYTIQVTVNGDVGNPNKLGNDIGEAIIMRLDRIEREQRDDRKLDSRVAKLVEIGGERA